jgi:hypothetical protein
MLTKLCAISLLALALSPFTAPFQTCDLADSANGTGTDEAVMLTPPTVTHTSLSDGAGSLVPPLTTAAGRLRLTPVSELVISTLVALPPVAYVAPPVTPPPDISGSSFPPTVLRV